MIFTGKALKYGDNIDTDCIIPGKYLSISDPKELASHAMEGVDPQFHNTCKENNILVVGKNFGCGSSREQAVLCLKHSGIKIIIGKSFARIFFRNAINQGLYLIESYDAYDKIANFDELKVDMNKGIITILSNNLIVNFNQLPGFLQNIIESGGLVEQLKQMKD